MVLRGTEGLFVATVQRANNKCFDPLVLIVLKQDGSQARDSDTCTQSKGNLRLALFSFRAESSAYFCQLNKDLHSFQLKGQMEKKAHEFCDNKVWSTNRQ